jgi:hypothetical protein
VKKIIVIISFLTIPLVLFFIVKSKKKNLQKELAEIRGQSLSSIVPNRENYDSLVRVDVEKGNTFLTNSVYSSILYDSEFPYPETQLDFIVTTKIIKILNDSSSYQWGEVGTPEYPRVLIYLNRKEQKLGYTLLEKDGEADSFPYLSFMKWGALTQHSKKEIHKLISNKITNVK